MESMEHMVDVPLNDDGFRRESNPSRNIRNNDPSVTRDPPITDVSDFTVTTEVTEPPMVTNRGRLRSSTSSTGTQSAYKRLANSGDDPIEPKDRYNTIYGTLILAGLGYLLPYNCFITAVDYMLDKYPDSTIVFDMSLTYIVVAFLSVMLANVLVESFGIHVRITVGYVFAILPMIFIMIFEIWLELFSSDAAYYVILLSVGTVALGCTVQQSSFYGYSGMLPSRYTQAIMVGESASGVLSSTSRIVTKLLLKDERINTVVFFSITIVVLLLCLSLHHQAKDSKYILFYVTACKKNRPTQNENSSSTVPESVRMKVIKFDKPIISKSESMDSRHSEGVCEFDSGRSSPIIEFSSHQTNTSDYISAYHTTSSTTALQRRLSISQTVWPYMVSIGLAYFVTLCLFPGMESEVINCSFNDWTPVIMMAAFNFFDFIGKILSSLPHGWNPVCLVSSTSLRAVFIPVMLLCISPRTQPVLHGPVWPLLMSIGLGLTNGYFGSVPMILAPGKVAAVDREITGNLMTLSYNIGLTTGSAVAYLLRYIVGPRLDDFCDLGLSPTNITLTG